MLERFSLHDYSSALVGLVLPRTCVVCGKALALRERSICIECLADLPRTHFSLMARNQMADRFNALVQRSLDIAAFETEPPDAVPAGAAPHCKYSFAAALFFYRSSTGYVNISHRLKYNADFEVGRSFARMLGLEMAASPLYSDVEAVIPVPLHWSRRWSRGYNQAEVIAETLASSLGAELRTDVLCRKRRTRTQTKLSIEAKARNVAAAFRVRPSVMASFCKSGIPGQDSPQARTALRSSPASPALQRTPQCLGPPGNIFPKTPLCHYGHILLVDDVFTTGATLHACYMVLRAVCPPSVRISIATLACVGQ